VIQFIFVFLVIYWTIFGITQLLVFAWPVVVGLILLAVAYGITSHLVRRRLGIRRQLAAIEVARDSASARLDKAQADAEAAMWEEVRRHL
jgi:hypothetical protein